MSQVIFIISLTNTDFDLCSYKYDFINQAIWEKKILYTRTLTYFLEQ